MLDNRSLALLNIINGECTDSEYKVLEIAELVRAMPSEYKVDENGLRESLNALSLREYISVKYEDDKEVCLTPLSKGRFVFENRMDYEMERVENKRKYFIYACLGGLVGSFIPSVLCLIITLFFGGR